MLLEPHQVFARNTRLSGRSHDFTVATMSHRTTHYREYSLFARTARWWNDLPANIFPKCFDISVFKRSINQHFLYYPLFLSYLYIYPSTLSFLFQVNAGQCNYRGYHRCVGFARKKDER